MPLSGPERARYMRRRYAHRRKVALEFLGGKCWSCGTDRDLEVDHVDPSKKRHSMGRLFSMTLYKFFEELLLCQLLCGTCHRDKTLKDLGKKLAKGSHGTVSAYPYCGPPKCDLCRKAQTERMREYYKTHPRKR